MSGIIDHKGETHITRTITLTEEQAEPIDEFAAQQKMSFDEAFNRALLELLDEAEELRLYEEAKFEYIANPVTYSMSEAADILGLYDGEDQDA